MNLEVSHHAIVRYMDRVNPGLEFKDAKRELETLIRVAGPAQPEAREWGEEPEPDSEFIELVDGIAAGIKHGVICTVLTRGGTRPSRRAAKNKRRSQRRHARLLRSKSFTGKGRGRPEAPAWD